MRRARFSRKQRMLIINGILSIVLVLILLQLWLLTVTMNAFLGNDESVLLPAALASGICLILNCGLLWYLNRLEY